MICEKFEATLPLVANWRDNHIPISEAGDEIDQLLDTVPATLDDKSKWHKWVETIYKSKVTSEEIDNAIKVRCDKLPSK